uniref:NADH-ubiquinone oxidoreductase chain 2 n=1 Tax=Bombyx mandarina TaxID=7092 RepID=Q6JV93_BOMMA|nr:NADH dehydrogenase subunit 2 [Bombyx mandarina]ADE18196.1 NADH dehydrogenase subunit 2 [Bombyx mandarina]ADE18209.1 NADH dehydrogenase subunit 2 [Bombyx mandarina]ADE18274.1 NADH dehydrogenase subunit 2 [Bombyx mandarina]ADE18287.1 NADH dehydrogenase subunit 2 [Bombyx mandarina]
MFFFILINNNSNKMFFLFIMFFSTLISISSNSWFGCWIGLEINLLSFIPLISNSKNLLSVETSLKYFLTQSLASINFLFMILIKFSLLKNFNMNNIISIMMNSSLLMKMGSAPFHFWFPNIVEGLSWMNNFMLMTWQKISPMILLSYYFNKNFLIFMIIMNLIIGSLGGLNQTSLRKLLAFSSINNLGWMIFSIMISENLWLFYFLIYSMMIFMMISLFFLMNMYFMNQLFINNMNFFIKLNLLINFLSLGGLPPFMGFMPKWIIIKFLLINKFYFLTFIFMMTSLIIIYYYIRIIYSSFMFNYFKMKWMNLLMKNNMLLINLSSFISISSMILSTFIFM